MGTHSSGYYLIDSEFNIVHMNDTASSIYPNLKVGEKCYKCLMNLDEPCGPCPVVAGIQGPRAYTDPIRHITETVDAVEVPLPGKGIGHALVFATVGSNAEFAATLPTDANELRNLALIKALTLEYYDVFSVDLESEQVTLYRHDGKAIDVTSVYNQKMIYSDAIEAYISKYVHPEDVEKVRKRSELSYIANKLKTTESFAIHYRVAYKGEVHYYSRKIVRIGEADSFVNFVVGVTCEDEEVLSRQKSEELEKNLTEVEFDSLTGLYTKEAFMLHAERQLQANPETSYDLCVLNLENITLLTHQYGENETDKVLQLIGNILNTYVTDKNCIAYMGNGTYVSITENTSEEVRKNNIMAFKQQILDNSEISNLSLKWSLYTNIERDLPINTIYENTTYALSTIRSNNHEDYVEFDQSVLARMKMESSIEENFEEALKNGEIFALFQPKYAARSQKIVGAEALVRWIQPDGTIISPAVFIPVLENCGKIYELDAYVFELACKMQTLLNSFGIFGFPISVNLSRASMFKENIAENYSEIAARHGVRPASIPIEITESVAVRATAIRDFADDLINRGFVLHMDDFGSGYSSLASLQIIPFESIKLDKSLIGFIGRDDGESLLRHVISFAKECGHNVVAEGVETMEQYIFLRAIGCDMIQGYYFSKPVNGDMLIKMLTE